MADDLATVTDDELDEYLRHLAAKPWTPIRTKLTDPALDEWLHRHGSPSLH